MNMDVHAVKTSIRGQHWFQALTADFSRIEQGAESVWVADGQMAGKTVRVIAGFPHINTIFIRVLKMVRWGY